MKTIETKSESTIVLEKRLGKYTSDQLFKKLQSSTNTEELAVVKFLLEKRGKLTAKVEATEEVAPVAKKATDLKKIKLEILPIVLPVEEVAVVSETTELTIDQIIDAIYAMDNKEHNAALCALFPEDGVDDYNELPAETIAAVRTLYAEILNPTPKSTKKVVAKTAKVGKVTVGILKTEKAEMGKVAPKVKEASNNVEIPAELGIKVGDNVTFVAFKTKETVTGVVKRYFFDKADNASYFYILGEDKKFYCKMPKSVTKVK
jgi:plastocyanin